MSSTEQQTGTVERVEIASRFLKETREVHVYLPHNYSQLYKYPVLYINDGPDYMMMGRMISLLNDRFQDRLAGRFLVVFVPVDKSRRREDYHPEGARNEAYIRFFADELVPMIEEKFAAFPMGPARGIMGSSLGATAALHTLLSYPKKFHYLALQSGAFHESSFASVAGRRDLATVPVYQVVGLQEDQFKSGSGKVIDILALNRQMRDLLQAQGVEVEYGEYDHDHTWGFWQEDLPRALDHFVRHTSF
ncbi:alpha/beta hydrolase [Tumebacillus permanentifrigoris]|uniref:Enterochelin esterase-like enzyme n=1 Tax=Tumebacillus permanentifrigoris TaxID=378543 RepID=A0A316D7V3_9BACL|nr:alpha/beta hydrolase-fold protein [Tumebacillus permanentifrigoris]PWK12819.1 enterochelin esterase-like enzyme [Tumebacillus permanentifrigoris]